MPAIVEVVPEARSTVLVVGEVDMHTKSLEPGTLPVDQFVAVAQLVLVTPVQ
jgi:hypothetical protein